MTDKWLVNDQLSALSERTFWHDLLDCGLVDKTGGYTPFDRLADKIELESAAELPRIIVRNGTYFRSIKVPCKQIAFVQDIPTSKRLRDMQRCVMDDAYAVVFNSNYTRDQLGDARHSMVIPIGVDFELFKPLNEHDRESLMDHFGFGDTPTVLFVGAASQVKGWDFLCGLIESTNFHFAIVAKDGARFEHPRVTNFGKVAQPELVEIMNACSALVCTSETETQHLAGIEAAACGLPLVVPDVGIYHGIAGQRAFGVVVPNRSVSEYEEALGFVVAHPERFDSRRYFLDIGCDKVTCMNRWKELLA